MRHVGLMPAACRLKKTCKQKMDVIYMYALTNFRESVFIFDPSDLPEA